MDLYYYIFLALGSFITTLIGTRGVILTLRHKRMLLDVPNARSNHTIPVPRGGGIAVVMSLMIFLLLADQSYLLVFSLLLLASISLVDDWIHLGPLTRLIVQIMAVGVMLPEMSPHFPELGLPLWIEQSFILALWVWFINLFNFMDGIDGMATSETISICAGLLMITTLTGSFGDSLSLGALVILAAGAGFLWWNWHPAKIFLGDVGSIPLGFLLGYLLLRASDTGYVYAALILPAYYLCDASITLAHRAWRREKIWQAHSKHFYQQAVRSGHSHEAVVRVVLGMNMLLILLASLATLDVSFGWPALGISYGMVLAVLFFWFKAKS